MHGPAWQLKGQSARLQCDRLEATVDLLRPAEGLVGICWAAGRLSGAQVLGIVIPWLPTGDARSCIECYVRGTDLRAAYEQPASQPLRVDACWRLLRPKPSEEYVVALELVVSVRADLPDSRPELAVQSELSSSETLRLVDAETFGYKRLAPPPQVPMDMQPEDGPGCLLFRLAGKELSYAEMVHPADYRRSELLGRAEDGGTMRVSHPLFDQRLEKGVILRARVRGLFLPCEADTRIAAACYTAFAVAEPPLST
jgi:hypothetical protein